MTQALDQEQPDERHETVVAAHGLAQTAEILPGQYQWVVTNVPYLARGKQSDRLRAFCERRYPSAKKDLATASISGEAVNAILLTLAHRRLGQLGALLGETDAANITHGLDVSESVALHQKAAGLLAEEIARKRAERERVEAQS